MTIPPAVLPALWLALVFEQRRTRSSRTRVSFGVSGAAKSFITACARQPGEYSEWVRAGGLPGVKAAQAGEQVAGSGALGQGTWPANAAGLACNFHPTCGAAW